MSELQIYLDKALKECTLASRPEKGTNICLGEKIARLRNEQGMTQKELADLCGIQQSNISRLEKGAYNPSMLLLDKIAKALGKTLEINFK